MRDLNFVLSELYSSGVRLFLDNGELKAKSKKGGFTPELVALIKEHKKELKKYLRSISVPEIVAILDRCDCVLSFSQQRLWLLDQIDGGSGHYNIPGAIHLSGQLNIAAVEKVFSCILERHEILRTCFAAGDRGEPVQCIQKAAPISLPIIDLSTLNEADYLLKLALLIEEEASHVFDLGCDLMLRARLIKQSNTKHILLVTMHHIASDGWSMSILINEFNVLYSAFVQGQENPLTPLPIQYADYAQWQRGWLRGDVLDAQLSYWVSQLVDLPVVHSLPLDKPRPKVQTYTGSAHTSTINFVSAKRLNTLCLSEGATLFMGLHAVFSVLLSRYSNEKDIVVGSPIANREQAEITDLIGFFVNTLVLRSDLSESPTFISLLNQSKQMLLDAYAHQQVPFEQIVERLQPERSLSHSPLFQVMLVLQNNEEGILELPGLTLNKLERSNTTANYDLTLNVHESEGGLSLYWEYNTGLFESTTIEGMANHFERLLRSLTVTPEQNVFEAEMLSEAEVHQQLVEWNATKVEYPKDKCLHELFEIQAKHAPSSVAVVFEGQQLTYGELNKKANQLACYLITNKEIKPDSLIGICFERSLDMMVAILGVLKSGGAYVPLDPDYPKARLAYMLEDANLEIVITQTHLLDKVPLKATQTLCLDNVQLQVNLSSRSSVNLIPSAMGLTSRHLAYVIYTSGSTGEPKGVMIEHSNIVNQIMGLINLYQYQPEDKVLQFSALNFDMSIEDVFCTISSGAMLVLRTDEWLVDPQAWCLLCEMAGITVTDLPTVFWEAIANESGIQIPKKIRQIMIGGEAVAVAALTSWWADTEYRPKLYNAYGPTEATINATIGECKQGSSPLSIGTPVANTQIYILDEFLNLLPRGVRGELYIAGDNISRGYLGREKATSEKFIDNPFCGQSSSKRLYKTGDLVRWLPDGNLEFLGRIDHQVKIRGFRIELGEIENILGSHQLVNDVVVIAKEQADGDKRLLAYTVVDEIAAVKQGQFIEELRQYIEKTLPDYMIPSAFVLLDSLPLTPNGKVDRKALPEPDFTTQQLEYVAPRTETEKLLCEIWQNLFALENVGIFDNFFKIGGDSISVMRLVFEIKKRGFSVSAKAVFKHQTISELSCSLKLTDSTKKHIPNTKIIPYSMPGNRSWYFKRTKDLEKWGATYHFELNDTVSRKDTVNRVIYELVDLHEGLRIKIVDESGVKKEIITPLGNFNCFSYEDLSQSTPTNIQKKIDDFQSNVNFSESMIKFLYCDLGKGKRDQVIMVIHHLAIDQYSANIVFEDFIQAYRAILAGVEFKGSRVGSSYSEWVSGVDGWLKTKDAEKNNLFWKSEILKNVDSLPVDYSFSHELNTIGNIRDHNFEMSIEQTDQLLKASKKLNVQEFDIISAALAKSITFWSKTTMFCYELVTSGREEFDHLDLSGTVGWLNDFIPIFIDVEECMGKVKLINEASRSLKECMAHAKGFSDLKYRRGGSTSVNEMSSIFDPEIAINYIPRTLSVRTKKESDSSMINILSVSEMKGLNREAIHKLAIEISYRNDCLSVSLYFGEKIYRRESIEALAELCSKNIIGFSGV